jgi:hypothetical protein
LLLALSSLTACSSEADRVTGALFGRLEASVDVLRAHKGDNDAAAKALTGIYKDRHKDILAYRQTILALEAEMSESDRKAYRKRLADLRAEIEILIRTYPEPIPLLQIIARMY